MKQLAWAVAVACLLTAGGVSAGPELVAFPEDYKTTFTYVTTRDQHLTAR